MYSGLRSREIVQHDHDVHDRLTSANQCCIDRLVLHVLLLYHYVFMLPNVASTPFPCGTLLTLAVQCSLFTTSQIRRLAVVFVITTEQSAVTLMPCTSDVYISLFQDFYQFHSLYFQRCKKLRPSLLGALNAGGHCALHNLYNL